MQIVSLLGTFYTKKLEKYLSEFLSSQSLKKEKKMHAHICSEKWVCKARVCNNLARASEPIKLHYIYVTTVVCITH